MRLLNNLGIVIARSQGRGEKGGVMTTKQSARLHLDSVNRDCFVVLHTLHHLSALLAMTRSGLLQQSPNETPLFFISIACSE